MSGFQDTFTRNKQEEELQYDDTAAYFFFASILAIILVPFVIHLIFYYFKKPTFDGTRVIDKKKLELNLKEFSKRKFTGFYYCKVYSSPFPSFFGLLTADLHRYLPALPPGRLHRKGQRFEEPQDLRPLCHTRN